MNDSIIDKIDKELQKLKSKPENPPEEVKVSSNQSLFAETYPFYISPNKQTIWNFNYGDRVVNVNSHTKNFVDFGEIGTVIGFTDNELIVLFDNENLSLSNLYD